MQKLVYVGLYLFHTKLFFFFYPPSYLVAEK